MVESLGTFWSWLSAQHVVDCWQPEMLRPEYVQLDQELSGPDYAPLREFVSLVTEPPGPDQPVRWRADSFGVSRFPVSGRRPSDDASPDVALPSESILVSKRWHDAPSVHFWSDDVFRGRGSASPSLWVLRGRTDAPIAWLLAELTNHAGSLQLRRAVSTGVVSALSAESLLEIRVRNLDLASQSKLSSAVATQTANRFASATQQAVRRFFVLTGVSFEDRLSQFEQYLQTQELFAASDCHFVEPATRSKDSDLFVVRPATTTTDESVMASSLVVLSEPDVTRKWREWLWDDSSVINYRIYNSLAADDELPSVLLMRTISEQPRFLAIDRGERSLVPSFSVFRDSILPNLSPEGLDVRQAKRDLATRWLEVHEARDLSAEDIHFGSVYGLGSAALLALAESSDFLDDLFRWASHIYRPALAIRVARNDQVVGAYLLFGQEQLDDHVSAYAWLDEIGVALSEALLPPSHLVEDATRRESLRRLSWVMHQLNGPVGRAQRALEDLQEFLVDHTQITEKLVPDDEKANRRARMPGGAPLSRQTFGARLDDAMKAIGDVRKITYQVRRLKRVQGDLPKSPFSLSDLLRSRCESCFGQLPGLAAECNELSDVTVVANKDSIREAVDEVLNNACRELRERNVHEPKLILKCWAELDSAWISISDNGLPVTIRLIADPFEEDASTYAASGRGTGLGLAIVRETFRGHGGSCLLSENFADDERVPGVTFTASLPIRPPTPHKGGRNA